MTDVQIFHQGGVFFEGPRWREDRWWVSDMLAQKVLTLSPNGQIDEVMKVEAQPSGLGWLPDGSLLVVSMHDQKVLRRSPEGEVGVHADMFGLFGGPANDMVVDARGHAYVGNFGFDVGAGEDPRPTSLVHLDPSGKASVAAEDMDFPNGMVITPDGGTLIVGETMGSRYTAFSVADDGALEDRRVWAQLADPPELGSFAETLERLQFTPDGCTLDADGHIWSADFAGARCARIAPGGEITDEIRVPENLTAFACMLGGEDGRTLLICAGPGLDVFENPQPDGVLLTATVDVPHAGLP